MIIAIDGPAGAGKSTVARAVARALGLRYLDTGAMYRAIALSVLRDGADPESEEATSRAAASHRLAFDAAGRILIDGQPGEPDIRGPEVTRIVSNVSAHPAVRAAVVTQQRAIASAAGGVVAEGRDTTTVVFPEAPHKFFLIATPRVRALRRARELGQPERIRAVEAELAERDRLDSTREHSPLQRAPDARVIDTDGLSVEQVVERILSAVRAQA